MSTLYYHAGPPQSIGCNCWCFPGTTERCNIYWERPCTVSCIQRSLQFSVSLTLPDGTSAYSDSFGQDNTSTQTMPLNQSIQYSATITAENLCGNTTCSVHCSSG